MVDVELRPTKSGPETLNGAGQKTLLEDFQAQIFVCRGIGRGDKNELKRHQWSFGSY